MIRVACSRAELKEAIEAQAPDWNAWSDIKPVFLDKQHHKCGYCESEIGGRLDPVDGRRETHGQDVEHFRPKGRVTDWSPPPHWQGVPDLKMGPAEGYPWLGLRSANYLASCKACNSGRKRNYFPIRSPLDSYAEEPDVGALREEKAYLLFPFGELEEKAPEEYISFLGAKPIPHPDLEDGSHDYWRAKITIQLLGLERADLDVPRKKLVVRLAKDWCLSRLVSPDSWSNILKQEKMPDKPFSSCAKNYLELCQEQPKLAQAVAIQTAEELGMIQEEIDILNKFWPDKD